MKTGRGRHLLVLLHRYVGLALVFFLVVAGLTGSLLAYREPLMHALSPRLHDAPARGAVLPLDELIARVQRQLPGVTLTGYPLGRTEGRGVSFGVAPVAGAAALGYDEVWADPASGTVLGRVDNAAMPPGRDSLMAFVYRLHYALALPGAWGGWIMGIAAILWLFDSIVGFVLTLPRGRPFLVKWRPAWGIKARRLNYDTHRAGGLWLWPLLAVLALSSIYFNLGQQVFMPVYGLVADTTPEPYDTLPQRPPAEQRPSVLTPWEVERRALADAARLGWQGAPRFTYWNGEQGFWQVYFDKAASHWATAGGYALFYDDQRGALLHVRAPGGTGGDVFLQWLSALHTASVFGAPYRLLLCLTGIGIAVLSVTGVVIWLRKRRSAAVHRARAAPAAVAPPVAGSAAPPQAVPTSSFPPSQTFPSSQRSLAAPVRKPVA